MPICLFTCMSLVMKELTGNDRILVLVRSAYFLYEPHVIYMSHVCPYIYIYIYIHIYICVYIYIYIGDQGDRGMNPGHWYNV